jgi:hypothetical protein
MHELIGKSYLNMFYRILVDNIAKTLPCDKPLNFV